jgi:hypothetical protein
MTSFSKIGVFMNIFDTQNMGVGIIIVEREYSLNIPKMKTRAHTRDIIIFI